MAKRRKKRIKGKYLYKLRPVNLFVRRGKVLWGRVLLALLLLFALVMYVNNLQQEVKREAAIELANEPFDKLTKAEFINRIRPEAQKLEKVYGVRASISIAQAALESNWGHSTLSSTYYNFFGVKAAAGQPAVTLKTSEYTDDHWITIDGSFRRYDSWQESMESHAKLLVLGTTDNPQRYQGVINATNYEDAAKALYTGGYATDPDYAQKVIAIIKKYQLYKYDINK
ncbi:mannosyl-glycoprotein endo-beta-N-acetylglucosamidase [Weissella oryzae SG25]|uniref:Mannosyl-glycoprotein endo-beta-N-acetylglucosamidase n=1 Tax=Weissella oryzae (strain DSM 25784 / JCM 18191 / LMG 30913 / SG25) TaxID=1329250 RepID=A0A069CWJ7_WEIOS|nr:glycoside hydrolase family 73 protein [Weissella oryzae]GAK31747.1 mannosyl-glycoprotein endo-beta-N-acetylglucosamidase [Weissella oryzae SG25]